LKEENRDSMTAVLVTGPTAMEDRTRRFFPSSGRKHL